MIQLLRRRTEFDQKKKREAVGFTWSRVISRLQSSIALASVIRPIWTKRRAGSSPSHAVGLLRLSSVPRIDHHSGSERNRPRRNVHVRVFSRCWSFLMNRRDRPVVERRRDQWHCFECSYLQREKERKGLQISIYFFFVQEKKERKKETGAKRIVDRPASSCWSLYFRCRIENETNHNSKQC